MTHEEQILDEKTVGLLVMGSILVAFGALASFMHIRQQEQDARRAKSQVRRLRVQDANIHGARRLHR